ncbi:MAG: hypothetical protein ABIC04_00865 [Nanoarchaeota archaeon]
MITVLAVSATTYSIIQPVEKKTLFEFVYAPLKGFNVTNCSFYYPLDRFIENFFPENGLVQAITKPFHIITGKEHVALNCTNVNITNSSHIVYEYIKVKRGESNEIKTCVHPGP